MRTYVIRNEAQRASIIDKLSKASLERPFAIEVGYVDSARTLSQNALCHVWYGEIAKALTMSVVQVRCECKLRLGVPILRAEDEYFRNAYDDALKWLPYEKKIRAMEIFPVTSVMTKDQLSQYLSSMQREYAGQGVILESPNG